MPSRGKLCFTGQICDIFVKSVTCLCFLITNIKYDFFNSFTLVIPPATWVSSLSCLSQCWFWPGGTYWIGIYENINLKPKYVLVCKMRIILNKKVLNDKFWVTFDQFGQKKCLICQNIYFGHFLESNWPMVIYTQTITQWSYALHIDIVRQ